MPANWRGWDRTCCGRRSGPTRKRCCASAWPSVRRRQPDAWTTFNAKSLLGEALAGQTKYADAEPLLLAGYEGLKAKEKDHAAGGKEERAGERSTGSSTCTPPGASRTRRRRGGPSCRRPGRRRREAVAVRWAFQRDGPPTSSQEQSHDRGSAVPRRAVPTRGRAGRVPGRALPRPGPAPPRRGAAGRPRRGRHARPVPRHRGVHAAGGGRRAAEAAGHDTSARTSCSRRSAKAAWATSGSPSRPSRSSGRSRSSSSRPAWTRRQVLARFEAERQALALMDHPNIAKVLDGGTTDDGPAVLRHGTGQGRAAHQVLRREPAHARSSGWNCSCPICQAVQHAHQKGIIHRDLKPSNILVAAVRRQAGAQGDRLRRGQGDGAQADRRTLFTAVRRGGRHAGIHGPGAGGAERRSTSTRGPTSTRWA